MAKVAEKLNITLQICVFAMALLFMGVGSFPVPTVVASQLQNRTLRLSNNIPGQISQYEITMDIPTSGTFGSIRVEICSNLALLYYPCTPPGGFNLIGATILSQAGITGFSIDPSTTASVLVLSRAPSAVAAGTIVVSLGNVTNQASAGSAFARYYTYASNDASGSVTDDGALAFHLNDNFAVSAEVPPYLTFCVGKTISLDCSDVDSGFVQIGQLSTARAATGTSQFAIATNADNGYNVRVHGQSMTSGNNVIAPLATARQSIPGSNQFGINLRSNSIPNSGSDPNGPGAGIPATAYGQANTFKFVSGETIANGTTVEDYRRFTVTYLININRNQAGGVYASSFSYIALGNF